MRTTVDLPDDLLRQARELAAREGRTLSEVLADAVRTGFVRTSRRRDERIELPTFNGGGVQPGVNLDDGAELLDLMERSD
jgi:ribbon-helix-helix CopG family protein